MACPPALGGWVRDRVVLLTGSEPGQKGRLCPTASNPSTHTLAGKGPTGHPPSWDGKGNVGGSWLRPGEVKASKRRWGLPE